MASMREIKRRKTSIQSTAQITKAMKLVSTVKFQKAKVKAETPVRILTRCMRQCLLSCQDQAIFTIVI